MGALDCVTKGGMMSGTDSTEVFTINLSSNSTLNDSRRDLEAQPKHTRTKHSIWWTVGIDLPLFIVVLSLVLLFELGVIPSHKAGFFCNDPALSYTFTGDSVPTVVLMLGVLLVPVIAIWITETVFVESDGTIRSRFAPAARRTLWLKRSYIYGFLLNLGLIEIMKGLTGRPRPTFFDICQPDTAKTCNGSEFVPTFECTSTEFSSWMMKDSYHSFPSGHTSLSVHCGLFMAWYLQRRAFDWSHRTVFVVPVLQMSFILFAVVSSLTRVTDFRHHWWDVLVGTIIGFASAYYAIVSLSDNFSYMKPKPRYTEERRSEETPRALKSPILDGVRGDVSP